MLLLPPRMDDCGHKSCPRCNRWQDSTMMLIHAEGCRIRFSVEGRMPFRARRAMLLAIAASIFIRLPAWQVDKSVLGCISASSDTTLASLSKNLQSGAE